MTAPAARPALPTPITRPLYRLADGAPRVQEVWRFVGYVVTVTTNAERRGDGNRRTYTGRVLSVGLLTGGTTTWALVLQGHHSTSQLIPLVHIERLAVTR